MFEFSFEMSPLSLNNLCEINNKMINVINQTPLTCPIKKSPIKKIWVIIMNGNENTTKCSSVLYNDELITNPQNDHKKLKALRSFECEDVFPKNTLENDHDILLLKAKKNFTEKCKKFSTFTIIEKGISSQQGRTILQLLRERSSDNLDHEDN